MCKNRRKKVRKLKGKRDDIVSFLERLFADERASRNNVLECTEQFVLLTAPWS
jgi:hypothetical protein